MPTMTAVRLHTIGAADALRVDRVERPEPGPGQALVRVAAIGVNFADVAQRRGTYPVDGELPRTLGFEAAGTVTAVGPGAEDTLVGRRVAVMGPGAYADYLVADLATLVPVPEGLDWPQAAAFLAQGLTAYGILHTAGLRAGETVLVHAAAGGVGTLAVQIARQLGAGRVVGTASTPEKRTLAEKLGADHTVDYTVDDWTSRLTELLDHGTVDIALDLVGGAATAATVPLLTPGTGRIVLAGMAAGLPRLEATALVARGVAAIGFTVPAWLARPDVGPAAATRLTGWVADGVVRPVVGVTYPLRDAAAAHRALEERQTTGKVVLLTEAA